MNYTRDDIRFDQITPRSFENLCYDLLVKYNFHDLVWRDGGADSGRDIEAKFTFSNTIRNVETRWFFECKHYNAGGVPPEHLGSKIIWADAERPDYLVFLVSSRITNPARQWMDTIVAQGKYYKIMLIEGEELKDRLGKYPDLIERYFSHDRYERMFKEIKDHKNKFNINPSYEILKEIIENIDRSKLEVDEIVFLLSSFYNQYGYFEARDDHFGDFEPDIVNPLLDELKAKVTQETLPSFEPYTEDYDYLGGKGMFDEMDWLDSTNGSSELLKRKYNFQEYVLHLNPKKEESKWRTAGYLFIVHDDTAFEIFETDKVEVRIIKEFTPEKLLTLSLKQSENVVDQYKAYIGAFGATEKTGI